MKTTFLLKKTYQQKYHFPPCWFSLKIDMEINTNKNKLIPTVNINNNKKKCH